MAIDFKSFLQCAPHVIKVRKPILIRGRHGIGKSEVVYQIAESLDLPVVERRASQMTEGDLLGMPSPEMIEINGQQASQFRPFAWFIQACTEPVVLFLDEVDRATTEVRQGIFELTDSRKLAGWTLHDDTVVIAAVNGGEHGAQYQVAEMDPAELDRWTVFDIEPTVEDWLTWASDKKVEPVVWDFINENRNHLEHASGNYEPGKVYPSRRSWVRFSETIRIMREELSESELFSLTQGFLGFEAAIAFRDFYINHDRMVTVDDILDKGDIKLTEEFDINKHGALIEKMENSKIFDETELSSQQLDNLAAYFVTIPGEMAMKLFSIVGRCAIRDNIINFHGAEVDGKRVGDHIVSLVQKTVEE